MNDVAAHESRPRFTYSLLASSLHDRDAIERLTAEVRGLLTQEGGLEAAADVDPSRPHLLVVATGGTERAVLELVERRRVVQAPEPTVLVAHPGHNSLPAALESLAALQQTGHRGRIAYLDGSDSDRDTIDEAVTDLEAVLRFRSARLGLVGGPSEWLVASSPSPAVVRRRWGPLIEVVDPARLTGVTQPTAGRPSTQVLARLTTDPGHVSPRAIAEATTVGATLGDVVDSERLDAVAVRCFDLLTDPGTSGCLALASLNDAGVVAGCEGDLPSTLAMMWFRFLLDQPSWMANPARVDIAANQVTLAHCTVAPSMVEEVELSTHFESGIGVGIAGRFGRQPVTMVRIGGRDLEECWIAEGHIDASGNEPDLCRTQATVSLEDRPISELLAHPLGNHLVLARGHHRARLERWWRLAIEGDTVSA